MSRANQAKQINSQAGLLLKIALLSDTTFGRGDGVAGLVDDEIEHDSTTGLPIIRGRALKGLLVEECANILFALNYQKQSTTDWEKVAAWLFGKAGSSLTDNAHLRIGYGTLPANLAEYVRNQTEYTGAQILSSLTTIRQQTAINEESGVAEKGSLRSSRVLLRGLIFTSPLDFDQTPSTAHLALLSACAASVRRAGSGRNRGRGRVRLTIEGAAIHFGQFDQQLREFAILVGV